jgi:hypothetical protein
MKVVSRQLTKFEKDSTPISEAYSAFVDLPAEFEAAHLIPRELKTVKDIVHERFELVHSDAHGLAYLLDPRFCGKGMDVATRTSVESFLASCLGDDQADNVLAQLTGYYQYVTELKDGASRQWKLLCDCMLPVIDFWCGLKQFGLLQTIAKQLFRCASSTAASERNFSTHALIHSKLRNRLDPARVEKLVHIFFNAKNMSEDEVEEKMHLEDLLLNMEEDE